MAGEACSCDGVVERRNQRRERELTADVPCRLLAQRKTVFSAGLVEDFGLHARDVHAGGTFRLARLAADAEVHDLLHALSRQFFGREGAFDHGPEHVGPRPRGVLFVEGHHIGGTHRAPRPLAAESTPVAQLDGLREAALVIEGEARLYGEASPAWADTQLPVHGRRVYDNARVHHPIGVEEALDIREGAQDLPPIHLLHELRTREAVAMLTGHGPTAVDDEVRDLLGDAPHSRDAI